MDSELTTHEASTHIGAPMKRHLHVACAIIEQHGTVLAAQRSAIMPLPFKWEFPGGKIEVGESPEQCLHRELMEELGISVVIESALSPTCHSYPDFTVTLYPFTCRLADGTLTRHEHHELRWVPPRQMPELDWATADLPIIAEYLTMTTVAESLPA
jgi:8-oxo-dGTP diphosphatase